MRKLLKIVSWNINQLKSSVYNKSRDKYFLAEISRYDIFGILETKHSKDDFFDFGQDFRSISVPRPKEEKYPVSGGIIILLKNSIKPGIKIIKNTSSEIQWIRLTKEFFGFEKDLYICFTYFAPSNSSYVTRNNLDVLQILEHNVTEYSQIGNVIICGDLNARTGTEIECTDFDSYVPTSFDHVDYHLPFRSSHDSFVNKRGRDLIDFCISHDLHFLNGRTVVDLNRKFTCFQ